MKELSKLCQFYYWIRNIKKNYEIVQLYFVKENSFETLNIT